MAALSWERPALLQANNCGGSSYLFYGQVLEFGQRAGEQSHQEGGRAAHDVNHGWGQDRNEGVLPGERVQQGHYGVGAAWQGAGERGTTTLAKAVLGSEHLPPAEKLSLLKYKCPSLSLLTSDSLGPLPVHTLSVLCSVVAHRRLQTKGKNLESICFVAVRRLFDLEVKIQCSRKHSKAATLNNA